MQPGGFDLSQLMESAQAMQAQMAQAQASLADARVSGSAGGGLVRADVDGNGQLVGLAIDPSVVDPTDVETLSDLVVAAVRDGMRAAESTARQAMTSVAGGLMGGLGAAGVADGPVVGGIDAGEGSGETDDDRSGPAASEGR